MKTGYWFRCLFWAALYCLLYLVSASEEDLVDFDFTDLKEIDWNYENDNENAGNDMATVGDKKLHNNNNLVTFDAKDDDDMEKNQVHPFDWREKVLRTALSKALTNVALRQKFVEVMPILRVLSSQQRLALSALISAQINAKKGQELKLEQVRLMFGNDKKLLIPLVYDIANLVRNSARKYIHIGYDFEPSTLTKLETPADRRQLELSSAEAAAEDSAAMIGTIQISNDDGDDDDAGSLEDFLAEMPEDVLDAQSINEELQSSAATVTKRTTTRSSTTTTTPTTAASPKRSKRAAATPTEFVHKLIRSVPLSVNEDELQRGAAGRTIKLNTTAFTGAKESIVYAVPATEGSTTATPATTTVTEDRAHLSYQEVEDLAFASLNGSEVHLGGGGADATHTAAALKEEPLPSPEELIAGPRYRFGGGGNKLHQLQRPTNVAEKRKRVQMRARPKGSPPAGGGTKKCERFTASMCLRSEDYPLDQIMGSIRRHKNAMGALLAEYHDKSYTNLDLDDFEDFSYQKRRREDEATGGSMCQSIVRYARPQKARSASGEWKYIVNTGKHTQTLRLEKCTNPQESCSYLAHSYRSHCAQIYNYHRLLSWDKARGLHVDIFKVPTCCSCQIDGYRQQFPPLDSINAKDGFTPSYNAHDAYSTLNEELDYNDDDLDEDDAYGYQQHNDANELLLGSKKVRTKAYLPAAASPTVGAFLSPPDNAEYDTHYARKKQRASSGSGSGFSSATSSAGGANNLLSYYTHRRPHRNDHRDRADLEIAPSETHTDKEVNNLFGPHSVAAGDKNAVRVPQKRKRISYSVPYTASANAVTSAAAVGVPHAIIPTSSVAASGATRSSGSSSVATNAHQTHSTAAAAAAAAAAANSPAYYAPNFISSGSKTRFRVFKPSASETAATAPPSTTEPPTRRQSAALPAIYHVNSIFSAKYNNATSPTSTSTATSTSLGHSTSATSATSSTAVGVGGGGGGAPKRINYSYHPIIDFFQNSRRSAAAAAAPADVDTEFNATSSQSGVESSSASVSNEAIYPHKILKYQTRDRRIGFGLAGVNVAEDNAWQPVVVES